MIHVLVVGSFIFLLLLKDFTRLSQKECIVRGQDMPLHLCDRRKDYTLEMLEAPSFGGLMLTGTKAFFYSC